MPLRNKNAVIYGGGGSIGGAVARAFTRDGARVFLAGRTAAKLETTARDIIAAGGRAEFALIDALNEQAVERHAAGVLADAGSIDIAINAVGIRHVQGVTLLELRPADYLHPIDVYTRTNFITAKAVARHMVKQGSGVILTLSTPGARMVGRGFLGNGVSSAAVEAFSRLLAGELGANGVRVVCLRSHAIPEAVGVSHTRAAFQGMADLHGLTVPELLEDLAGATLLKRLPTLAEVADFAAFVASDRAGAMTGAVINLSCGALVD